MFSGSVSLESLSSSTFNPCSNMRDVFLAIVMIPSLFLLV